jgi:chromatin remodeling complex protein RSC6
MSSKNRKSTKTEEVVPEPVAAPVVEVAPVEATAEESNETYESVMTVVREKRAAIKVLDKEVDALMKMAEKLHAREVKAGGKSKRSAPKKDRAPSGFAKATPVPEALRKFLGLAADVELPRTEVAKQIYAYVRDKKLRDEADRRIIHPDKVLQKLFSLKEGETLDFKNFQKQLSRHYPQSASKAKAEAEVAAAPEVVEEVVANKRRSRVANA